MKVFGAQIIVAVVFLADALSVAACDWCRIEAKKSVYAGDFVSNLLLLLLPVAVLSAIGVSVYFKDDIAENIRKWKIETK